mgnify:CR=1 FL=1
MKWLTALYNKLFVKVVTVEVIKEVPVYELVISSDLLADLQKKFPRRMYVAGMNIEHFAENAGQYHVIMHLQKVLNKASQNPDITKRL